MGQEMNIFLLNPGIPWMLENMCSLLRPVLKEASSFSTTAAPFLHSIDFLQMRKNLQRLFPTYGGRKQGSFACTETFTLQAKLPNLGNHKGPWKLLSLWAEAWSPKCTQYGAQGLRKRCIHSSEAWLRDSGSRSCGYLSMSRSRVTSWSRSEAAWTAEQCRGFQWLERQRDSSQGEVCPGLTSDLQHTRE